jgi:Cu2+-containing amine oxidase
MKGYILRWWLALDQFVQAAWPNRGLTGITISARAETARYHDHKWGCYLCKLLDWIERDHCHNARLNDMKRAKAAYESLRDWR